MKHKIIKFKPDNYYIWLIVLSFPIIYFLQNVPHITEIFTGILAIIGLLNLFFRKRIKRTELLQLAISFIPLFYTNSSEGIRYFLLMIAIIGWSRFSCEKLITGIKMIVIFGVIFSLAQIITGEDRITGFADGSPTQFACILLSCIVFILVFVFNGGEKKELFYVAISIALIFLTGTRTLLIGAILAFGYYFLCDSIQNSKFKNKKYLFYILILVATVIVAIVSSGLMDVVSSKMGRTEQQMEYSNSTRLYLIQVVLKEYIKNPIKIIFGYGSGYVEIILRKIIGFREYLPVHQDFILILTEFGILGIVVLYIFFLRKHRAKWIFLFMFLICSFHNGILNTRNMLLMVMIMQNIEQNNYKIIPYNVQKGRKEQI